MSHKLPKPPICLVAIFAGCLYIDQPLSMYASLAHTRSTWQEYQDWYVVRDFGIEGERFTGDPMELSRNMYDWYANHEHDDGVYLANTSRFKGTTIQAYIGTDETLAPFWYLAASPSYLEHIGMDVPSDLVQKAEQGTRVYLLPNTLSSSEVSEMKDLLVAARRPADSNIVTPFMKDPKYEFVTYDASNELFTWSTDSQESVTSSGFVIALVTANNMVPFESESLVASGLEDTYVKLDEHAASNLLSDDSSAALNDSTSVRFATVGNYIDGLQTTLKELFALFSVVLLVLVASVAVLIVCLISVVNRVNAREVSVKYMLGFGTWGLYRREIMFVNITALIGIAISMVAHCKAGLLVGMALIVISNIAISVTSRKRTASVVLDTVSKE